MNTIYQFLECNEEQPNKISRAIRKWLFFFFYALYVFEIICFFFRFFELSLLVITKFMLNFLILFKRSNVNIISQVFHLLYLSRQRFLVLLCVI